MPVLENCLRIFESPKSRLEWNLKFIPWVDLIKRSGISFHSWNLSSYNRLIHGHWKFAIFEFISTFLIATSSKEFRRVACLNSGVKLFQMKAFCIFCISSINCFNVKCTILDSVNVLKIIIFPSSVIFLILHWFKICYWCFSRNVFVSVTLIIRKMFT